ncbi:MAG: preprotein translocase subunit YajC [Ruminococcus sp.]|nr:preprotein translocase subunit YajC [Ruminococcus sp.]
MTAITNFFSQNSWAIIFVYVALFAVLYFLLIRPNSKKKKQEQEMRNNIAIGDEITTIGGIVGRIVAVKEDEDAFIIETGSDRVKMKFKKWAISSVDSDKGPTAAEKAKEEKAKAKAEKKAQKEKEKARKNQ